MTFPILPNRPAVAGSALQGADFTDSRADLGTDHFSHAPGRTCKKCDRPIEARQPARRSGADDWVHDVCPDVTD